MGCKRCNQNPVISRRYSGEILCKTCFFKSFERNAQRELRKQVNLLIKNSNIKIKKIGIGLSGGKDSTVALHILKSYVGDRNIEIVGLSVDEGIENYRSESLDCALSECKKLEINIWNAIKASSTKPFGFMSFYPGPGTGGHCIPLDPNYLSWKARSKNFFSRYIFMYQTQKIINIKKIF